MVTLQTQTNCTVAGSHGVAMMIPGSYTFDTVTNVTTVGGGSVGLDLRSGAVIIVDASNPPQVFVTDGADTLLAVIAVRTVCLFLALLLGVGLFISYKMGRKG